MSTAREVAIEVLPYFERAVLAGHVHSYGHYANVIGRDAATESLVIGSAMHAIGGACVICGIPVAPLHYVQRSDGEWSSIFESNPSERTHVLPHFNTLLVTAREHRYSAQNFQRIHNALHKVLPEHLRADQLSPHDIWNLAIYLKLKDGSTIFGRALAKYQHEFEELRKAWRQQNVAQPNAPADSLLPPLS